MIGSDVLFYLKKLSWTFSLPLSICWHVDMLLRLFFFPCHEDEYSTLGDGEEMRQRTFQN